MVEPIANTTPDSHPSLIIRAVHWLFNVHKCYVVLTQPRAGAIIEEPDAIGWNESDCLLVEVKVNKTDFYQGQKKYSQIKVYNNLLGSRRYFFTPEDLIPAKTVDPSWGLLWLIGEGIHIVREAPLQQPSERHVVAEQLLLVRALQKEAEWQTMPVLEGYGINPIPKNPQLWIRDKAGNIYRQTGRGMTLSFLDRDLKKQLFYGQGTKRTKKLA